MRILFLARSLRSGGAERQLAGLARGLHAAGHEVGVAVFYGGGRFEEELRAAGVPVHDLAKRGRWDTLPFLARLVRCVRRERPDVLHSYMDSPNIVAAALRAVFPSLRLVWGLRSSKDDFSAYDWLATAAAKVERLASPLAHAVIANSEAAARTARALGFDDAKLFVVPNGIDAAKFRLDPEGRARLRAEWGVAPDAPLVGMVARLDPVKDHATFLRAAAAVNAARPDVRFACVGGGKSAYADSLRRLAQELGLDGRLTWAGERQVSSSEYSAFDVAVLSSGRGEGFPNAIAEAMACGRPVVATESGDARAIVGEAGVVVPTKDADALARGILAVLGEAEASGELSARARARIEREYSVDALVRRTTEVLERVRSAG